MAQNIKGVVILGCNFAQVDGDEIYGFDKPGFNIGFASIMPFNEKENFNLSIETIFNQKGAYQKYPFEYDSVKCYPYYHLKLNYAEVPVLFQYTDKKIMTFETGFSWGRLVQMTEIEHGSKVPWKIGAGPYDRNDWNILVGFKLRIYEKWHFNLRYAYSIKKIRTRQYDNGVYQWERDQYNNLVSFRICYILNDSYKSLAKKKKK